MQAQIHSDGGYFSNIYKSHLLTSAETIQFMTQRLLPCIGQTNKTRGLIIL